MFFIKSALAAASVPEDVDISHLPNPAKNILPTTKISELFTLDAFNIINFVFILVGLFFFTNIVLAGWDYMLSSGDPKKVSAATTRFTNGFIGLIMAITAFVVVRVVTQMIGLKNII